MKLFTPPGPDDGQADARTERQRKAGGLLFALLVQTIIGVAVLTLTPKAMFVDMANSVMESFNVAEEAKPAAEPEPVKQTEAQRPQTVPEPQPSPPVVVPPAPPTVDPPPVIEVPSEVMAQLDIARVPQAAPPRPVGPVMGPPDLRPPSRDSERVEGSGPNGEPLYAASWYREPYPDELRGYLSTAYGPGWGMIACRTVRDYRVEDCFIVGESPVGSRIANAVLQASWQFKVRPPILKGQPQYGEWVRIRIDYERRNNASYGR